MTNAPEMTVEEMKARKDRLENAIFFEEMSERPSMSFIETCRAEIKALDIFIEKAGGRWSE